MKFEQAGIVWTHPKKCSPLDDVKLEYIWNGLKGGKVRFVVFDAAHHKYIEQTVTSGEGKVEITIKAAGKPGVHHIKVFASRPDGTEYQRSGCFRVECKTLISTDTGEIDDIFAQIEEGLRQSIDITMVDGKPVTYFKVGDNTRQNIAYPAFAFAAYRYFIEDMKTAFEALFSQQYPNGSLPDHIYGDDYPCPLTTRRLRSSMADIETGAASMIYRSWQAHGDNRWVKDILPKVEKAMDFVMTDPQMFDIKHGVIKRPHSLDEWDIHFTEDGNGGAYLSDDCSFVIMQGDTSGMYDACYSLAELYNAVNQKDRANHWRMMHKHFGKIGNELFWDGVKYLHHIHLDPFDHRDFNENDQLTMSNSFAITRGFANHTQAVSIINEYMRRLKETGDRFPWWSLQPGYPDELGYFKDADPWRRAQGNYANGGLFPCVGGELCRGAFQHGLENLAVSFLRDYHYVLKRDNGAIFTWYDLEGNAIISSPTNQTNYDAQFGFAPWAQAILEELAGIKSKGKCFEEVICAPRWAVTDNSEATVTAHFPASDTYFSYNYKLSEKEIKINFTGSGKQVFFHILLPKGKKCGKIIIDGKEAIFKEELIENSLYINIDSKIKAVKELVCSFK